MTKKHLLLFLTITLITLSACKKDSDVFIPDPDQLTGPDSTWHNTITTTMPAAILKNSLALSPETDTLNVTANPFSFKTAASTLQFNFPGEVLIDNNDIYVTGSVQAQTIFVRKKGDLIRMSTPTVDENKLLVSGGTFYTAFRQYSNKLKLAAGAKFNARFKEIQPYPSMHIFNAESIGPDKFSWTRNGDEDNNNIAAFNDSIKIESNRLNWVNCAYYFDFSGSEKTRIVTDMPQNFTNSSTIVYLVFKNIRSVVELYGTEDSYKFSSIDVPVGQQATVVIISKQGDYYYLGTQNITTTKPAIGSNYQTVSINPVKTSLDNIKAYLNTL